MRPGKNRVDGDLLRDHVGDGHMLRDMPIIGDVWLKRQTLAEIFGLGLQKTEILAAAAQRGQSREDGHAGQVNPSGTLDPVLHRELKMPPGTMSQHRSTVYGITDLIASRNGEVWRTIAIHNVALFVFAFQRSLSVIERACGNQFRNMLAFVEARLVVFHTASSECRKMIVSAVHGGWRTIAISLIQRACADAVRALV